jgi:hypothetical protein
MYEVGPLQGRYEAMQQHPSEELENECALLRALAEQTVKDGKYGLATSILNVLAKVSSARQSLAVQSGELLPRELAVRVFLAFGDLVTETLRAHHVPDWETIVAELSRQIPHVIERVENPPDPPLLEAPQ